MEVRQTTQMKKILVPIGFSENASAAYAHARCLAEEFGASIVLMHVVRASLYSDYSGGVSIG